MPFLSSKDAKSISFLGSMQKTKGPKLKYLNFIFDQSLSQEF